ncbi:hypothetical protein GIB67_041344 [Kingdonia uniflora]|uniref:Uncharacterized protein n=1 Tax=Kingdonia uniflora TaxID=39325 RepID=A0A7J7NIP4_9MAGN|nr:hypothetical protein GIB67_041344 [Kingdonia uniflora]
MASSCSKVLVLDVNGGAIEYFFVPSSKVLLGLEELFAELQLPRAFLRLDPNVVNDVIALFMLRRGLLKVKLLGECGPISIFVHNDRPMVGTNDGKITDGRRVVRERAQPGGRPIVRILKRRKGLDERLNAIGGGGEDGEVNVIAPGEPESPSMLLRGIHGWGWIGFGGDCCGDSPNRGKLNRETNTTEIAVENSPNSLHLLDFSPTSASSFGFYTQLVVNSLYNFHRLDFRLNEELNLILIQGTVFLTALMEPYGYSLPVPSPDKGGGKRIKIHGTLSTFGVCDLVEVFELKSLFFLAKALVDIYGLSLNISWELPEIAPVSSNKSRLHKLAACIVSPQQCLLLGFSSQDSLSAESRSKLLDKVQKSLPPTVMIPERRLEHLVEQALTVQCEACVFHNSLDSSISLYSDHRCGKYHIPSETLQERKPYTITKQRERWTDDEHNRFLQALKLYGRAWQRIEEHIGTKTTVQIRSHAQKFFSKVVAIPIR